MAKAKAIRTEADYDAALARVRELWNAEPGPPEGDELDALVDLMEAYEDEHYPIGCPSPLGAMEFLVDQAAGVPAYLGTPSEVREALAGECPVTPKMAQALHEQFGIPYDVLLPDQPELAAAPAASAAASANP